MMLFDYMKAQYGGKKAFLRYWYFKLLSFIGVFKENKSPPYKVNRIVFVCKGNVCRSAWAECYFKSISKIPVCSIGLDTTSGSYAEAKVIAYASANGHSLAEHRALSVRDFVSMPNDLYVCMEPLHMTWLKQSTDIDEKNMTLLGLWHTPLIPYIHDPYSANEEYTSQCMSVITAAVNRMHGFLYELNQKE